MKVVYNDCVVPLLPCRFTVHLISINTPTANAYKLPMPAVDAKPI
jgi:hypothetical protein